MNQSDKKNQWAVITGASSGIGFELAKQFAMNGFNVLVTAEDPGIAEAAQSFKQYGIDVDHLQADLTKPEEVEKLYVRIKQVARPLEAVAINAGVGVGGASFDKTDLKKELSMLQLNVVSVVHLTKLVLKDMLLAGHGRILFTSSVAAFMPGPYESVYSGTKAFVQSFAEGLRAENKDKGIIITALQPGPTETNFFHRADMDDTKIAQSKKDDPEQVAEQGFKALMEGEDSIIAGSFKNKVQANLAKISPQQVAAKMHERLTKPNSPKNR
jgi:uncharacterized protein